MQSPCAALFLLWDMFVIRGFIPLFQSLFPPKFLGVSMGKSTLKKGSKRILWDEAISLRPKTYVNDLACRTARDFQTMLFDAFARIARPTVSLLLTATCFTRISFVQLCG